MGLNKTLTLWVAILLLISFTFIVTPSTGIRTLNEGSSENPEDSEYPNDEDDNETAKDEKNNRIAIIDTSYGIIKFELYELHAPITTSNFIMLANDFFYDGILFHRIIDDFVIQTGDPNTKDNNPYNDGSGGSRDTIPLEIHPELTHIDGAVGMARSTDPDSASSQFYICDGPQHGLDGDYAVFGVVFEGIEIVRKIAQVETWGNKRPLLQDHPIEDVIMYSVFIMDNNSEFNYIPEEEEDPFWLTWSTPGFEGGFILAGVIIIILLQRKGKYKKLNEYK